MSDSESSDDFVEVTGYQSSDSEWERIEVENSDNERDCVPTNDTAFSPTTPELVTSYYRAPDGSHVQHLQEGPETTTPLTEPTNPPLPIVTPSEVLKAKTSGGRNSPKRGKDSGRKKQQWAKIAAKREQGAPYDPVEFLGITEADKGILNRYAITTIAQLAYFNVIAYVPDTDPESIATLLDLQEKASEAVTDYVTKTSALPQILWGYVYLGKAAHKRILENGYIDSESLNFLWAPMPTNLYRDSVAIDDLVGKETKNREIRDRYSRVLKINLTKLCMKHFGRLYRKDPCDLTAPTKWFSVSLSEGADYALRPDLWLNFEPGNDIFNLVAHGSIVVPSGKIPRKFMEFDTDPNTFPTQNYESDGYASSGDERDGKRIDHNDHPALLYKVHDVGARRHTTWVYDTVS